MVEFGPLISVDELLELLEDGFGQIVIDVGEKWCEAGQSRPSYGRGFYPLKT